MFYPALAHHPQLVILPAPQTKVWRVYVDLIILSAGTSTGPLYDAVTLAARAALWDLKIPKTRGIAFQSKSKSKQEPSQKEAAAAGSSTMDIDQTEMLGMKGLLRSGRGGTKAAAGSEVDFELESYWDEGAPLKDREQLPVAITLNLVRSYDPLPEAAPIRSSLLSLQAGKHVFLDASTHEALAAPSRVICAYNGQGHLVAIRQDAELELEFSRVADLLDVRNI